MLPLGAGDLELHKKVRTSITGVRLAARQVYAVLFAAQAAGATIEMTEDGPQCKPHNDRAKAILTALFTPGEAAAHEIIQLHKAGDAKQVAVFPTLGKAPVYEARKYVLDCLLPTVRSFVWDELRQQVWSRWTARDPEFPRASRGWLSLQNARGLAAFRGLGIGFPKLTARPVLAAHRLTLAWDRDIGPVEFRLGDLDPGRWAVWRKLVSGEWDHGTIQLNEWDGKLRAYVSYHAPIKREDLDATRTLDVLVQGETMRFTGPEAGLVDEISLVEARDWALRVLRQREAWERRRAAVGSPVREWGQRRRFRAIAEHQRRVTRTRENGAHSRNHAWAKRAVARAVSWRCGVVSVAGLPEDLCGHPWQWYHFTQVLRYKLEAAGGKVVGGQSTAAAQPATT